jgi:hypothetical protein
MLKSGTQRNQPMSQQVKPDATNRNHLLSATSLCHDQQQSSNAVGRDHSDNNAKHIRS